MKVKHTEILDVERNISTVSYFEFQGCKEYMMRAHFKLPSVESEDSEAKPPIYVRFEIPYYTVSGLQVNNLYIVPFSYGHFHAVKQDQKI